METLLQTLASALTAGAVYGLLGMGFSLTFRTRGVFNFAHGNLALLGAYVAAILFQADLPLPVAALAGILAASLAGGAMERLVLRPLYGRPIDAAILATVGVAIIIESAIRLLWGSVPRTLPALVPSEAFRAGPVTISPSQLTVLGVGLVGCLVMVMVIERSRLGRAMRACAEDPEVVSLLGIPPQRIYQLAFLIAGGLAGLSGVLIAPEIGLEPSRGLSLTVFAFAAAVLGGLGSLPGAMLGGFMIAILYNLSAVYVDPNYADIGIYLIVTLVLLVRVRGLLGDELDALRRV